jgi:hypothetical protein
MNGLIADRNKAQSQAIYLEIQAQKASSTQSDMDVHQLNAQISEAKITAKSSMDRMEIVAEQIESMNVRSPQDGIITTFEARKNLMGRPVEIGTELLQVAATDGDWILEVEVPDDDMGPILAAKSKLDDDIKAGREKPDATLKANFISMTDPDHLYPSYVRKIAPSAETITEDDQYKNRHVVKVTLGFAEAIQKEYLERNKTSEMRPGSEVRARVKCGTTNLAYFLLRKPIQVLHESVLFRWPFLH